MYMTGLMIGNVDVEFHVLPFVISGVLIDPSNQDSSLLNPANQVISTDQVTEVTTGTVNNGQAETAQAAKVAVSAEDFDKAIDDYRTLNPAPEFDRSKLSPAGNKAITDAFDAEQSAVLTKDYSSSKAAVDKRNNAIQSAVDNNRAGEQTADSAKVQAAVDAKITNNTGKYVDPMTGKSVVVDWEARAKSQREESSIPKVERRITVPYNATTMMPPRL
jgi:hypothetical protein